MLKLLSDRRRETTIEYSRNFDYIGKMGWGFSFPSDELGNVDIATLQDAGRENYLKCIDPANPLKVVDRGVKRSEYSYVVPAVGQCQCGRNVTLDADYGDGIDCQCGRIYNLSGQELAPRAQWERDDPYYEQD